MIVVLATLACTGLILLLLSRVLLLRQTRDLHAGIRLAVWLPGGDLVYLAGAWQRHTAAALFSVLGFALLLPVGGQLLWEKQHAGISAAQATLQEQLGGIWKSDRKTAEAAALQARQENLWVHKSAKVDELTGYLAVWHASLQHRRATLASVSPQEVLVFNREAEAYHELLRVAKAEKEALETLPKPAGT